MQDVVIAGVGMTPVAEHWDKSLRTLAVEAIDAARNDAGVTQIDAIYVGNAFGASFSSQTHLGPLIADHAGLSGVEAYTVEAADASGGAALRAGYMAVASGLLESVLVVGVEKSADRVGAERVESRSVALDADFEAVHGATLTALAAMLMRRYMYEYAVDLNAFEGFSVNAHANGKRNPFAMYRNTVRAGAFAKAPMVAEPVNLFDGAPDGDGAAALLLTSVPMAETLGIDPVFVRGSAAATDTLALHDRTDMLYLKAVAASTGDALRQARIDRSDVDVFEMHDSFTIMSVLALEAAGFAGRGQGWTFANDEHIGLNSPLPISTFGGLKSRGNPVGAAGVYQAVEATLQLRGEAGDNQVANARTALIQSIGGLGSTAISHILSV
jgi:acetyl-CoA C-acetyltransferase